MLDEQKNPLFHPDWSETSSSCDSTSSEVIKWFGWGRDPNLSHYYWHFPLQLSDRIHTDVQFKYDVINYDVVIGKKIPINVFGKLACSSDRNVAVPVPRYVIFPRKAFVFSWTTFHLLANISHSLKKCCSQNSKKSFRFPETLCICWQNFHVTLRNIKFTHRPFKFH